MTATFEKCFICGSDMHPVRESRRMSIGKRSAVVEIELFRCVACGEEFVLPERAAATQRALASVLREREGLLTPDRIKQIRGQYALTQSELECLLRTGPKTAIRWERGTVFQNQATDQLLRIIEAVPAAFEYLARANGVPIRLKVERRPTSESQPEATITFTRPEVKVPTRRSDKSRKVLAFRREHLLKNPKPRPDVPLPMIPVEALK